MLQIKQICSWEFETKTKLKKSYHVTYALKFIYTLRRWLWDLLWIIHSFIHLSCRRRVCAYKKRERERKNGRALITIKCINSMSALWMHVQRMFRVANNEHHYFRLQYTDEKRDETGRAGTERDDTDQIREHKYNHNCFWTTINRVSESTGKCSRIKRK